MHYILSILLVIWIIGLFFEWVLTDFRYMYFVAAVVIWLAISYSRKAIKKISLMAKQRTKEDPEDLIIRSTDYAIVRPHDYVRKIFSINDQYHSSNNTAKSQALKTAGDYGEAIVLSYLESAGRCIAYWNIGLNHKGRKAEYDILAVTPYGLLHLEVKNFSGIWHPTDSALFLNPDNWQKIDTENGKVTVVHSPFKQACRAKKILEDTLKDGVMPVVPIYTVVCFTNESFQMMGMDDNRLPWRDVGIDLLLKDFVNGDLEGLSEVSPSTMLQIVEYFGDGGQYPVFFDDSLCAAEPTRGGFYDA